jgi:hypothetical protein
MIGRAAVFFAPAATNPAAGDVVAGERPLNEPR